MIASDDVIYQVSELNQIVRQILEEGLPNIWVEGEISNLACPASGHAYFTLKDENAQVRCVMFRLNQLKLDFSLKEGIQVLLRAKTSVYALRGDFQLIVEEMSLSGDGALRRAFEYLKQKLLKEGLFDLSRKKKIPDFPQRIGVITSPIGAAVHDILTVLKKRFSAIPVIIYPTQVQGEAAVVQIKKALQTAFLRHECDVLILARGGGSLEDLAAFNDESLARLIAESSLPIVTGIGHEIDFTIADFVADARAPTPSAAAALVSPDQTEWLSQLTQQWMRLKWLMMHLWQQKRHQFMLTEKKLRHPGTLIFEQIQRLDEIAQQLQTTMRQQIFQYHQQFQLYQVKFAMLSPHHVIQKKQHLLRDIFQRLNNAVEKQRQLAQQRFEKCVIALEVVSPLATLKRGYAIALTMEKQVLRSSLQIAIQECIEVRLHDGSLKCRVIDK